MNHQQKSLNKNDSALMRQGFKNTAELDLCLSCQTAVGTHDLFILCWQVHQ